MFVRELVEKYGLGITVSCGKYGYPPFTVLERKGEKNFLCRCADGRTFELVDCLNDYELHESPTPQTVPSPQ